MNTNAIPSEIPYISTLLKYNDALAGLPSLPLVVIGCIVIGYMCKLIPVVSNRWIPAIVFLAGILMNLGIAKPDNWVRSLIFGLIAGAASIVIHRKLLKDWIDADVFPDNGDKKNPPGLPMVLIPFMLMLTLALGCAAIKPGNDPIVVRTEQFLRASQDTFLLSLRYDQMDRGFWKTNAPAFHNYCEILRKPTAYGTRTNLPQYRVMLLSLNDVKGDYKSGKATSNELFTALSVLQGLQKQGSAWLTIVTNR